MSNKRTLTGLPDLSTQVEARDMAERLTTERRRAASVQAAITYSATVEGGVTPDKLLDVAARVDAFLAGE